MSKKKIKVRSSKKKVKKNNKKMNDANEVAAAVKRVFNQKKSSINSIKISVEFKDDKRRSSSKKNKIDVMTYDIKKDQQLKMSHQSYDPTTCYKTPKKSLDNSRDLQEKLYPYGDPSKDFVVP